ncbi:MAG: RNA polymerase sigma factor [Acidimicrobiales bacterium]|nr:RNA polymerase sigma factor [Acidimicrobiales bacterium]
MTAHDEDADLARARDGDPGAFERLLRRHDDKMRGVAHRFLGGQAAMDDALQEAYLKAYRRIGEFRGDASFSTWLYRIVTTTCLDQGRTITRRAEDELPDEPMPPGVGPRHDRVAEAAVGRTDLRRALDRVAPEHRAALLLVDGEGMTYEEASGVLDVPPGTLASRLARARTTMRELLDAGRLDSEGDVVAGPGVRVGSVGAPGIRPPLPLPAAPGEVTDAEIVEGTSAIVYAVAGPDGHRIRVVDGSVPDREGELAASDDATPFVLTPDGSRLFTAGGSAEDPVVIETPLER